MTAVDFSSWVIPDLVLALGGKDYTVPPPSVEDSKAILALAVQSETRLGLAEGDMPAELEAVLAELDKKGTPRGVVSLGQAVYDELVADGFPPMTIDRVAVYAVHFWARGRARADAIARALWEPREASDADGEDESPKA